MSVPARTEVAVSTLHDRAWMVPLGSLKLTVLVCVAVSTQFVFQWSVLQDWPAAAIGSAWLDNFWQAMLVASAILIVLVLAGQAPIRHGGAKLAWFCCALLASTYLGEWAVLWLQWGTWPTAGVAAILPRAFRWLPIAAISAMIILGQQRARDLSSRLHHTDISRLQLGQQQAALQLQLLQSQVEPHFLFNTLATIRRLHRTDPGRGRETLAGFIHYLKASLPGMRECETTLGRELDLVSAYVDVLRVRMGERLQFGMQVEPALRSQRIPPFSVATLVENAVKHGLAGLPGGGSISVSARLESECIKVTVADTGPGLTAISGTGTGLANLRSRLRSLYGDQGILSLTANAPKGLVATVQVPLRRLDNVGSTDAA